MPDVNARRLLQALSHVKDTRKSLAEAEYLRRARQQRISQQNCTAHAQNLECRKSALPQQTAAILTELAARPVDQQQIHSAYQTVRKLHEGIDALEQERKALEQTHHQACIDKDSAQHDFAAATRQQEKFQQIQMRSDARMTQQSTEREQVELEDRPSACSHLSAFQ